MATTVRSSDSATNASAISITVTAPAGTAAGDLSIVVVSANGIVSVTDNNGSTPWTKDDQTQDTSSGETVAIFSRRIVGGDPASYSFNSSGGFDRITAVAVTFQNPHPSTIYDATPVGNANNGGPSTTTITALSVTTAAANAINCAVFCSDASNNTISALPGGYTVEKNVGDQRIAFTDKVIASPGATGDLTATQAAADGWVGYQFAIADNPAGPTFPVIEGTAETAVTTAGTSHTITLPASIASTDLVLILMDIGSTAATLNALTDWTELLDENLANGLKILWYTGSGVPGNPTFTSSAATRSASIAYRISGADKTITPQVGSTSSGTSTTPDPPASANPPSTKDYLFLTFFGGAGEEVDDDTWANTPPGSYLPSPPLQKACGTAGSSLGGKIAAASRQLTTGSAENPGTFNQDVSTAWRAQTVTVHPPPVSAFPPLPLVVDTAVGRASSW